MKKVEEGKYVRISYMYRNVKIARIEKVLEKDPCYKNMQMYRIDDMVKHDGSSILTNEIYQEDIIKHSKDLAALIEIGDIVNGDEITYISKDPFVKGQIDLWTDRDIQDSFGDISRVRYITEDIKTVLTKEQIKEMEYRVWNKKSLK